MTANISGRPSSHEGYGLHLHSSATSMSTSPNTFADVALALDEAAGQTGDVHSPMVGDMMVLERATGDHNTVATVTDGCRAAGIMVVDGRSYCRNADLETGKTPHFVAARLLTCPTELAEYEDRHRAALNSVTKDFQAQKDALNEMGTVLQSREAGLALLRAELEKEHTELQEQLRNEQRLVTQQNHAQLEAYQRRFGAEKEREMANLEQQYYRMRNVHTTPQADEMMGYRGECSTSSSSQPFQHPTLPLWPPRPVQTSTPHQGERSSSPSSQPFQHAAQQPPHPSRSAQFSQSNAPSLEAIKRIRRARGTSTRTRLLGVVVNDDIGIGTPSAARQMNSDEEHEPNDDDSSTVPVSAMMEAVTKGVEAALCNILAKGQTITSRCGRRNHCHRACEDEEVRLEKESESTIHRDFILADVHCLFKERLGITQDIDFITHQPATAEDIHTYEYEDGPGPDRNKLAFDLAQNYSSPWNTFILELLCQEFQARCEDKNWPIKRSDSYVMEILRERYKRLQTVWRNAQPKLTSKGALETPVETEAHLVEERMQIGKESRQANHRRNKYHRRILVLNQMVKLKSEMLGEHGMSSEESSVENGVENILRVKNMPWRRNIDRELEIVDFQRILDTDVFSPQGSKPLTRKRAPDNPSTTHSAAKALPLALYDGAWIAHLTEREIEALDVPQQTFPWMKVVVA
ncbi:hypothetical protein BKA82DRAFT_29036 [Pisolithus tinctorius]|uniref:Uncharacterized protein n=1 Tax=Pisolithus tinctorius Marx 270 TaxID=870435 RepID=A0A0C3P132_PISTI|nr:hypothetical protein BKA82DRAFT_29036 [Pisolithus tinctorius]KIO01074.1 hypothetical protein M404DRAFT_29036 [Pisolithus tinctorius Marx 270]